MNKDRCTLRDVCCSDLPTLYSFESDPAWYTMAKVKPRSAADFELAWKRIFRDWADEKIGVVQKAVLLDGEVCGTIGCRFIVNRWEIGYGFAKSYWGQGVATSAVNLFLDGVVERPLYAKVAVTNIASIRVLTKNKFVLVKKQIAKKTEHCLGREECVFIREHIGK
ncbi:MAG: GNAT family N-acetyltransferase [Phycisphaerales bacterium]